MGLGSVWVPARKLSVEQLTGGQDLGAVDEDEWVGHVARMGEKRITYMLRVGKPKGKRPLGRPRRWWIDNIKMDLEVGWGGMDWIGLTQDRDNW
jgi:hypothetical protein